MNTYVSKMKDVLSGFYPQMKRKREEKAEAKERYSADVAAQEIDRIDREATALRNATMDKLQQLHDEGVAQAQRWGNLDGSMITDDIKTIDDAINEATIDMRKIKEEANDRKDI